MTRTNFPSAAAVTANACRRVCICLWCEQVRETWTINLGIDQDRRQIRGAPKIDVVLCELLLDT